LAGAARASAVASAASAAAAVAGAGASAVASAAGAAAAVAGAAAAAAVARAARATTTTAAVSMEDKAGRGFSRRAAHRHHQNDTVHVTSRLKKNLITPHVRLRAAWPSEMVAITHFARRGDYDTPHLPGSVGV
jgi:hypothetical protein